MANRMVQWTKLQTEKNSSTPSIKQDWTMEQLALRLLLLQVTIICKPHQIANRGFGVQNGTLNGTLNGTPNGTPKSTLNGKPNGKPNGTPNGKQKYAVYQMGNMNLICSKWQTKLQTWCCNEPYVIQANAVNQIAHQIEKKVVSRWIQFTKGKPESSGELNGTPMKGHTYWQPGWYTLSKVTLKGKRMVQCRKRTPNCNQDRTVNRLVQYTKWKTKL